MKNIWDYKTNSELEGVYLCKTMLEKKAPKMHPHEVLLQKIDCFNFLKWIIFYRKHHQHFLAKKKKIKGGIPYVTPNKAVGHK